jgi:hypothetical protein
LSIDDVYELIQYIIAKNSGQGYLSPDEFNRVINIAQTSFLSLMLGQFQQYQVGRSAPKLAYSENETTRQRLSPFIKEATLTVNTSGFSNYPTDYQQVDAMISVYNFHRIRFVQQDSQYSYQNSVIDPVAQNPIFLVKQNGFQFYPTDMGQAKLSYVSTPETLKWAYITNVYGLPQYDAVNSVSPRWYDVDIMDIISRALRIVGVNLESRDVSQYANEIKNTGQ